MSFFYKEIRSENQASATLCQILYSLNITKKSVNISKKYLYIRQKFCRMCTQRLQSWLCLILHAWCVPLLAQANLIPNGGFEDSHSFPMSEGEFYHVRHWFSPNGKTDYPAGTPDYFSRRGVGRAALPRSCYGTVLPQDGEAVAALLVYTEDIQNFREYMSVRFAQPLEAGKRYKLCFYWSQGQGRQYYQGAVAQLGVWLSTQKPKQQLCSPIAARPQWLVPARPANDQWQRVEWVFEASESFEYLTIGHFEPDSQTQYTAVREAEEAGAYYFFDQFSLTAHEGPLEVLPALAQHQPNAHTDTEVVVSSLMHDIAKAVSDKAPPVEAAKPSAESLFDGRMVSNVTEIETSRLTMRIKVWDDREVDGDIISLHFNGQWLLEKYMVTKKPRIIELPIDPGGDNRLVFFAHNLGKSPPNTATVAFTDESGKERRIVVKSNLRECGAIFFKWKSSTSP